MDCGGVGRGEGRLSLIRGMGFRGKEWDRG